jgi:hypothetical protein
VDVINPPVRSLHGKFRDVGVDTRKRLTTVIASAAPRLRAHQRGR